MVCRFFKSYRWLVTGFCLCSWVKPVSAESNLANQIHADVIQICSNVSMMEVRRPLERIVAKGLPALKFLSGEIKKEKNRICKLRILRAINLILANNPNGKVSSKTLQEFMKLTTDEEFLVRYWSVKILGAMTDKEVATQVVATLKEVADNDEARPILRVQALYSIGKTGFGDKELLKQIEDSNHLIREAVCDSLTGYRTAAAIVTLYRGMLDKDVRVRLAALDIIRNLNNDNEFGYNPQFPIEGRIKPLEKWFQWFQSQDVTYHPDHMTILMAAPVTSVRVAVCTSLRDAKTARTLPCLIRGLSDPEEAVRQASLDSFAEMNLDKTFGYNAGAPEKERQTAVIKVLDWIIATKTDGLKQTDWLPVFNVLNDAGKIKILQYLKGIKTRSAALIIYWAARAPMLDVRNTALEALKALTGGKDLSYNPKAPEQELPIEAQKISDWIREHKSEFGGSEKKKPSK